MDTNELTLALREAAEDVETRPNFAADVLRGGRRRRSRNRFATGAAVASTAAVAVVAATVLPNHQAAPPPADQLGNHLSLLDSSHGEYIDDEDVTRAAILGWQDGIAGNAGELAPTDLRGEPNVYWAGRTPWGGDDVPDTSTTVAIVAQKAVLPGGVTKVVAGLVVNNPDDDRADEMELVSLQQGGLAYFMLPDLRTVIGAVPADLPENVVPLRISLASKIDENGKAFREWHDMQELTYDGVAVAQLPAGTNVHNVRLEYGTPETSFPTMALPPNTGEIQDRTLPWPVENLHVPEPRELATAAQTIFQGSLKGSHLLDPWSFDLGWDWDRWTVTADLPDGRILILGEFQELDNPAWVFAVLVRPDLTVETVTRVAQIDPAATEPVIVAAPEGQGTVVAAWDEPISYRTSASGEWVAAGTSAALVPADAVEIKVGDHVIPLS